MIAPTTPESTHPAPIERPDSQEVRSSRFHATAGLAGWMARRYVPKNEDARQAALMALWEATGGYPDDARAVESFERFAMRMIRRSLSVLPVDGAWNVTQGAYRQRVLRKGRDQGVPPTESLADTARVGGEPRASAPQPEAIGDLVEWIEAHLDRLTDSQRSVVVRLFGIGRPEMTPAEVAREFGVSRARISFIRAKAINRLRLNMSHESRLARKSNAFG